MRRFSARGNHLRIRKIEKREIKTRSIEVAELLQIGDLLQREDLTTLSGREQQRIALGRAIVRQPKVFLWGEPLGSLDAKLRRYLRAELKNLQKPLRSFR